MPKQLELGYMEAYRRAEAIVNYCSYYFSSLHRIQTTGQKEFAFTVEPLNRDEAVAKGLIDRSLTFGTGLYMGLARLLEGARNRLESLDRCLQGES